MSGRFSAERRLLNGGRICYNLVDTGTSHP
jgi:hypothetical protein